MTSSKPQSAAERIEALTSKLGGVKTEKLEKAKKPVRGKNGGVRPGSGRKPKAATLLERGIKEWVDQHINEMVDVKILAKDGTTTIVKRARVAAVLEKLYLIGMTENNADALNKWLDRALGKPVQAIVGDEEKPILLKVDF